MPLWPENIPQQKPCSTQVNHAFCVGTSKLVSSCQDIIYVGNHDISISSNKYYKVGIYGLWLEVEGLGM